VGFEPTTRFSETGLLPPGFQAYAFETLRPTELGDPGARAPSFDLALRIKQGNRATWQSGLGSCAGREDFRQIQVWCEKMGAKFRFGLDDQVERPRWLRRSQEGPIPNAFLIVCKSIQLFHLGWLSRPG
jgi:hypothetical protein